MRGTWGPKRLAVAAFAAMFTVSSVGTAWTVRASTFHANIDPSLRAGEVALVHTTAGQAGALSMKLAQAGAVDIETAAAADTVIARLTNDAIAAISTDATVTVAARDVEIHATGDGKGKSRYERSDKDLSSEIAAAMPLIAVRVPFAWMKTQGNGVTVAVMDTGIADHPDLDADKIKARVNFVNDGITQPDPGGHGTFLAGLIAADGTLKGVAPDAKLVSLRVLDANGNGTAVNVVRAFNWLLQHRTQYAINVLNVSWGATQTTTYQKDLLSALVESAWFSGITVVAAAGNNGPTAQTVTSPGSDPFVITVGSFADQATLDASDDRESSFSSRGPTLDGFMKPDTLAPGEHLLGLRVAGLSYYDVDGNLVGTPTDRYVHMTGTSAASALVSGIAALVKAARPAYTPTQIKGAIVASGRTISGSTTTAADAFAAMTSMTAVNVGLAPSGLLLSLLAKLHMLKATGATWEGITWEGITWEGLTWKGVTWDGVTWDGVTWDGVTWDGVTWDGVTWESVSWESVSWESVSWETVTWEAVTWERLIQ